MRLIYHGPAPVAFVALGAELFPGQEFDVPDESADAYLSRPDISPAPVAAARARSKTKPATGAEAPTAAEEKADGVPDSH